MNRTYIHSLLTVFALSLLVGTAACSGASEEHAEESREAGAMDSSAEHMAAEGAAIPEGSAEGEESREGGEHAERGASREGSEHEGEGGEEHAGEGEGGEGEEGGTYIPRAGVWDTVRRGARLILRFDASAGAFTGRVENTTNERMCAVRVEVHLRGGSELGPTDRVDLAAGQSTSVSLSTEGEAFEGWTAHPEIGRCSG